MPLSTRPARFSSALRRWEAASGLHRASFTGRPQPVAGFDPLAQAVAGECPHALGGCFSRLSKGCVEARDTELLDQLQIAVADFSASGLHWDQSQASREQCHREAPLPGGHINDLSGGGLEAAPGACQRQRGSSLISPWAGD